MIKKLIIILVIILVGCTSLPKPELSPGQPHLKLVTYNINWGGAFPDRIAEYLGKSDADVICLQETHNAWEKFLKEHLGKRYPYSAFKESGGAGGIAFMSKYQLKNIRYIKPEVGWFPALLVDIETSIGLIQILNVHLRPPLSNQGTVTISAYYNSSDIHIKELDQFLEKTKTNPQIPLIIAGDFNENENDRAISRLLDKGFTDALSLYDRHSDTWRWKLSSGITLDDRYDHVIFSRHLLCLGAYVTNIEASDHLPVFAVLINGTK